MLQRRERDATEAKWVKLRWWSKRFDLVTDGQTVASVLVQGWSRGTVLFRHRSYTLRQLR